MSDHDLSSSATPEIISYEEWTEKLKGMKTVDDACDFAKQLIGPAVQAMLDAEMERHLGYKRSARRPKGAEKNFRNGHSQKTLKTSFGPQEIDVPRDRDGTFEPQTVRKYGTITNDVEEKIVAMYAKGMTTRDINGYLEDIYGIEVSADTVSAITDKVLPLVREWQGRPLSSVYAVLYLDGVHFKVRDGGRIVNRCAYILLGISSDGQKEILGMYTAGTESAKFWMQVLTDIRNRGTKDILICCIDGLTGFPEAIKAVFPETVIQSCIVHQIRNSTKYVSYRHRDAFCQDLKAIYTAPTEDAGLLALASVQEKWPQYQHALKSWEAKWTELSPFFSYPPEIRRIMYTTNAIESLNRQLRKVTKTTTIFPHDESLLKLLWLAAQDITRTWTRQAVPHWGSIILQLSVLFPNRITL
jgi:putative transposase